MVTAEYWTLVGIDTCKPVLNSWVYKHIYPGGNRIVGARREYLQINRGGNRRVFDTLIFTGENLFSISLSYYEMSQIVHVL